MAFKLKSGNRPSFKDMGAKSTNTFRETVDPRVNVGSRGGYMSGNMYDEGASPNTSDRYARALKNDPNLPDYIKKRKTLEKGSDEWNANQDKINKAYEDPTRHSTEEVKSTATGTTDTDEPMKEKVKTKNVATGEVDKVKTKKYKSWETKKEVTVKKDKQKGTYTKKKIKYNKDGTIKKEKETKIGPKRYDRLVKKGKISPSGAKIED